jgi:hypothetical protein
MTAFSNPFTTAPTTQFEAQIGAWTNWSRGPVFGATLTLSRQNGNLLIAFTAFFIGLVSTRFWRILCLILHRYYSSAREHDVFHHQRQVILRNSANPESGIWIFGSLFWSWRHSTKHSLLRALPGIICAVVSLAAFTLASGFSSRISTGISDEVLIKGDNCGFLLVFPEYSDEATYTLTYSQMSQTVMTAANYAQQCYTVNGTNVFDCSTGYFVDPSLPTTVNVQAPCPFAPGTCLSNDSNLYLDSSFIDSNDHLGINAPPDERILWRQVMQCAPLTTEGFKSNITRVDNLTGSVTNYTQYNYGSAIYARTFEHVLLDNYTYEAPGLVQQYSEASYQQTYKLM